MRQSYIHISVTHFCEEALKFTLNYFLEGVLKNSALKIVECEKAITRCAEKAKLRLAKDRHFNRCRSLTRQKRQRVKTKMEIDLDFFEAFNIFITTNITFYSIMICFKGT